MANRAVVIFKKPGCVVPKDYMEKVAASFKTCIGIAMCDGSSLETAALEGDGINVDKFMKQQEAVYKDAACLIVAEHRDLPVEKDGMDLQPYVILSTGGEPAVCVAMEGDFAGGNEKSARPPEFFLASTYLTDKFKPLFEAVDGDVKKFMHAISGKATGQDMASRWKTRGTMVFLASNGEHVEFHVNPLMKEFDWGFTSNSMELTAVAPSAPAPEVKTEKKLTIQERLALLDKEEEEESPTKEKETDTKIPDTAGVDQDERIGPPDKVIKNEKLRAWYEENFGFLPPEYKKRPTLPRGLRTKHLQEMAKKGGQAEAVKDFKDLSQVVEKSKPEGELPIIGPKLREAVQEFWEKEAKPPAPDKIEHEAKIAGSSQIGKTLEESLGWSFDSRKDMAHKYPMFAALMWQEINYKYVSLMAEMEKVTAPAGETKTSGVPSVGKKKQTLEERLAALG
jgi:hypothetical protein